MNNLTRNNLISIIKLNSVKRIIVLSLVLSFLNPFISVIPFISNQNKAYAATIDKINNMSINEIEEIIITNLKDAGLTDNEVNEILISNPITKESLDGGLLISFEYGFTSRASVGDTKTNTVNITKQFVESVGYGITVGSSVAGWGLSKTDWLDVIVKAVGWKVFIAAGVAIGVAAACANYYLYGYTGVRLHLTWTYMYEDNSIDYFWGITRMNSVRY